MIIEDDVKNFKKFLETCYTKGLFGELYTKVDEEGVFTTSSISVTKSCGVKVSYKPRSVETDATLDKKKGKGKKAVVTYEDGELWCEPGKILGKMDNMRSGEVHVEFDGEKIFVKCGRSRFLSSVYADRDKVIAEKNVADADMPESMVYDADTGMGSIPVMSKVDLDHRIVVNSTDMQGLVNSRSKLAAASNFQFLVMDGNLSVSVVDMDDKSDKPDYFSVDLGEISGYKEGNNFKLLYMVGVSEMFGNLPGDVEMFLGSNAMFPFMLHKTFVETIKDGRESTHRNFLDVMYMNMPYSDPIPVETGEDLEAALEEALEESEDEVVEDDWDDA